jgi:hypothetical protein
MVFGMVVCFSMGQGSSFLVLWLAGGQIGRFALGLYSRLFDDAQGRAGGTPQAMKGALQNLVLMWRKAVRA